jgi:hypothetical protein
LNKLIGQAPNLVPAHLELFGNLSTPGKMNLYLADLASTMEGKRGIIREITILISTNENIEFVSTATVVIRIRDYACYG